MAKIAYSPRPQSLVALDRRDWPVYSLAETSYFLGIPKPTLHSWTREHAHRDQRVGPLIVLAGQSESLFSFYNLTEAHILSVTTRVHKLTHRKIRAAIHELQQQGLATDEHPLLSREFYTDGRDLFVKMIERTVNLSQGGQLAIKPILDQYLERIERDEYFRPKKLYPAKQQNRIVAMMPTVSSGRPVIDGTGIPVSSIWTRYQSGDSIEVIADDYDIAETQVEGAVNYVEQLKAA